MIRASSTPPSGQPVGSARGRERRGGHPAGDVASARTVEEVAHHLDRAGLVGTLSSRDGEESPRIGKRRLEAVQRVDVRVRELAAVNPSRQGTGTTLTALIARPSDSVVMIAHLGDGRAYAHEHGRRLTRDHTWVAQQLAAGRLTPEQASTSFSAFSHARGGRGEQIGAYVG